jgi:hypothetical protein
LTSMPRTSVSSMINSWMPSCGIPPRPASWPRRYLVLASHELQLGRPPTDARGLRLRLRSIWAGSGRPCDSGGGAGKSG